MNTPDTLVLEIIKEDAGLKMSLFGQKELTPTLRQYSRCIVSFDEIDKLSGEIISILNKADKKGLLQESLIRNLKNTGQLLWDQLLTKAIKDRLKESWESDLIMSLDEELINIPWELLYDGNNFLSLKFNMGRVVRTQGQISPTQYRSLSSTLKMLILANPTGDLKSAYLEGLNIRNQFDRKRREIKIDFKSTSIDTHYIKKNLRDYDLVHFAGHCEYDADNPKDTGWVLSDGKFNTQDILTMGQTISLPSLIFSNSCHSAYSEEDLLSQDFQEKNYSLASAFLFSGVRHYIGAIRKIEDPISLLFAEEFYSQLILGKTVGESLRLARLSSVKEQGIASIAWTSYILYGDPSFILFQSQTKPSKKKNKINIIAFKKLRPVVFAALVISSLLASAYFLLPSKNPNTYILFSRAKKMYLKGENQGVIKLCTDIIKKDSRYLAVYPLIGDTFRRLGNPDEALKYYFDYALASGKNKDRKHLASAYLGIGWIYHLQGDYPKAYDFYDKGLSVSIENKDKLNEADAFGKIAIWHIDKQDYEKALELLTKSSEINLERKHIYKHRYNLACDYFNLGLLFINKDDYQAAKKFYDKSFQIFDKLRLTYELSDYYFNVGEVYYYQKEYQKALDFYDKGLKIDREHGNLPSIAADYNMIGELYFEIGDLTEAEGFFQKALLVCENIKAPLETAYAYWNLGLVYKEKGKRNMAREYLRKAQEIFSKVETSEYEDIKKELLGFSSS